VAPKKLYYPQSDNNGKFLLD